MQSQIRRRIQGLDCMLTHPEACRYININRVPLIPVQEGGGGGEGKRLFSAYSIKYLHLY